MANVATGQLTLTDLNDARQLILYIGSSQSKTVVFGGGAYNPNYASTNQVLTPQLSIAGGLTDITNGVVSTKWYVQTNGSGTLTEITANTTDYTLTQVGTGGLKSLTLKTNLLTANRSLTYIAEVSYLDDLTKLNVVSKAEIEIVKIQNGSDGANGANAITAVISNESATIPTDSAGGNGIFTGASATVTIYEGATDVTASWTFAQTRSGVTVTEATTSKTATVTAMSTDTGYIDFVCSRSGYASVTKRFSLSKNKAGKDSTAYWLVTPSALQRNTLGAYVPTTLQIDLKYQTGSGAVSAYSGRMTVEESTDGTNYTNKYTSSANETAKTWTPTANIKAVRVRMYLAGGTTTMVDEQVIPVVFDGTDAIFMNVQTPDGNITNNGSGSVRVEADIFKGSVLVAGTGYKWYIQDPTATTTAGGDTDGGAGWRLLTSTTNFGITGYTADTITVPASAISGTDSFKCIATYNGTKYSAVATVMDYTDPIMVRLDGVNIFRNGEGTTNITASVFQNGVEIDATGTTYTYTWSIYTASGTKTAFAKTGKTVAVTGADIDGIGNLVCIISK